VVVLNHDGSFRYLSPSVHRVIGYHPDELMGEIAFNHMQEDDASEQLELFTNVVSDKDRNTTGLPRSFRFRHKDGHWVVLEAVSTKLPEGSDPPGIVVNARDITERVQAQDAWREVADSDRRLVQETEVVAEVGRIVSSTLNVEEVFELCAAQVKRLIDFDVLAASVIDYSAQTTSIRYWSGPRRFRDDMDTTVPLMGTLTGDVMATGKPVLVHATSEQEMRRKFVHLAESFHGGVLSWLAIPMVNQAQVVGALLIFSSKPNAFSDVDIALAGRIGNQIAGAIHNTELFAGLKQVQSELVISAIERGEAASRNQVIAEIGRIISSTLNVAEVFELIAAQVKPLINFDMLAACVIDYSQQTTAVRYWSGAQIFGDSFASSVPLVGSVTGKVVDTGQPVLVQGLSEEEIIRDYIWIYESYGAGIRSWLGLPMVNRGEMIGALLWLSAEPVAFSDTDVALAGRISNQIAGAIDNAELFAGLKRAEAELAVSVVERSEAAAQNQVIAEIGRIISSTMDVDDVYQLFANQMRNLFDFDDLAICVVDREGGPGRIAHLTGNGLTGIVVGSEVPINGSLTGEVGTLKRSVVIQGLSEPEIEKRLPFIVVSYRAGTRSWLCAPLINGGEFIGSVLMFSRDETAFNERDADLAQRVGNQIAGAVGGTRLFSDLKQAESELAISVVERSQAAAQNEVIAEIGRIISSTLDIDEVYDAFAAQVRKLISFDVLCVSVVEPDGGSLRVAHRVGNNLLGKTVGAPVPFEGSITGEVVRRKGAAIVQGMSKGELLERFPEVTATYQSGVRSWLCVPLLNRGEFVGTLLVLSTKRNAFDDHDADLAQRVGNQISGAVGGAELFAELKQAESKLAASAAERGEAASQNEAIAEIGRIIGSSLEIEDVYQPFADLVRNLIDCDVLAICILDSGGQFARIEHQVGESSTDRGVGSRVPIKGSLTGEVAKTRRTEIIQNKTEQELQGSYPYTVRGFQAGIRSWMCTPLISGGDLLGAMVMLSRSDNNFTMGDAGLAQRVGNQIAGAIGSAQLYADLKRAESDLVLSNDQNRMILETAHDAFIGMDERGQVVAWNSQAEETFGWPVGQAYRKRLSDLIIPDRFAARHLAGIKEFLATGSGEMLNRRIEIVAKHRDGHEFPVEITISPLKTGNRYVFNAFVRDITDRKNAEEALQRSEERYRAIYNNAANGIGTRTFGGEIKDLNPAFLQMVGYTLDEVKALGPGELFDVKYQEFEKGLWERALRGEEIEPYEKVYIRKDGTEVVTEVRPSLELDNDGNPIGILALFTDITDRMRLEQEIEQYTRSLELANDHLKQLDRMKDDFISTVSHELRTPLTSIKGSAELLLAYENEDPKVQLEFLKIIDRESDRLTRLINDVLDLSRMESRQMRWVWSELDFGEVVNEAVSGTQALSILKDLSVDVALDPELPMITSDRDRLVQVMNNLLSNAIKFTPRGGKITVRAKKAVTDESDGRQENLEVCISDTGIGIDRSDYHQIFEKFRQVGDTLSDKPTGTGLGLPICKEIVEYLGGRIWVESLPGEGSDFFFTMPVLAREHVLARETGTAAADSFP